MAIKVDSTGPFISLAQKCELIKAVRDAPATESEPDWLEWKSTVDLSEKRWQCEIARFVLGASNRLPDRASQNAGGFAYMLLGVEPQNLCGVTRIDNADLENGVGAYTGGDGPHWNPEYIEVDGADVLLVTIAPPKAGNPIFALAKEFDRYANGTVFVRRSGKTERATNSELRQLQGRLLSGHVRPQLDIDIEFVDPAFVLTPLDLGEASIEEWIEVQRRDLARPKPTPTKPSPNPPDPQEVTSQITAIQEIIRRSTSGTFEPRTVPEDRDPQEYDAAVEEYLRGLRAGIIGFARWMAVMSRLNVLRLLLRNRTPDNYEEVAVHLHLPGEPRAYYSVREAKEEAEVGDELPKRPRKWGPRTTRPRSLFSPPTIPRFSPPDINIHRPSIRNDGSTTIDFHSFHLRPEAIRRLDPILLVAAAGPDEIVGEWQATSRSVSGVARGTVVIPLGDPISLRELFTREVLNDDDLD
jgi:hypothetical protein